MEKTNLLLLSLDTFYEISWGSIYWQWAIFMLKILKMQWKTLIQYRLRDFKKSKSNLRNIAGQVAFNNFMFLLPITAINLTHAKSQLHSDLKLYYTTADGILTNAYRAPDFTQLGFAFQHNTAPASDIKFWNGDEAVQPDSHVTQVRIENIGHDCQFWSFLNTVNLITKADFPQKPKK